MPNIIDIESRWKEVTGLQHLDLSVSHFQKGDDQQQQTTKEEYENWDFVCTPLWTVDEMIETNLAIKLNSNTCDACCGCGQFSIRLMRKLYNKYPCEFDVNDWLKNHHTFTEFQFSNVAKLIYIFGTNINVYIGDSLNLKYSTEEESGLLFFDYKNKKWFNLPKLMELIEPHKDDLDALLGIFTTLEPKLMPLSKPKKVKEQKENPQKQPKTPNQPKVKVQKTSTPTSVIPKQSVPPKPKVKSTPAPQPKKQKFVENEVVMKIGGVYNPTIDFEDF